MTSTIVLVRRGGKGYEVEFVALDGETVAVPSVLTRRCARLFGFQRNRSCTSGYRCPTVTATV